MTDKTTLGDRMKEYEATTHQALLRRTPVIIRIDGRAFHTYVPKNFSEDTDPSLKQSPFSTALHGLMVSTTCELMRQIQNAVFAYTQSDEISILLRDWDRHETQQWFGGNLQKITSISAAVATSTFNHLARTQAGVRQDDVDDLAHFDSRAFNLPNTEVVNYFIWRQQDASRNSVQHLARFYFSHKQLHGKNNSQIQDMLMLEKGVNWNDIKTWMKRGTAVYRDTRNFMGVRCENALVTDLDIPIFTQDREFVAKHLVSPVNTQ